MAVAVERLPTFTPLDGDNMDNVRTNSSLFSTSLSHTKVIKAVARLLPGVKKTGTCLEAKSTPPIIILHCYLKNKTMYSSPCADTGCCSDGVTATVIPELKVPPDNLRPAVSA